VSSDVRIAVWSGPRNISTALMRAWETRPDTVVVDEPLYAHYLQKTGREHPGRDAIIDAYETDWRRVVERLTGSVPGEASIFYQKHMAHHLLPEMGTDWVHDLRNAFLLREPSAMLTSLMEVLPTPTLADTGLKQQWDLFETLRAATGTPPPVLAARDVLIDPEATLRALCDALGVPFRDTMLSWEPGRRESDGLWAEYWYDTVEQSTGFRPYEPKDTSVPARLQDLLAECQIYYDRLQEYRLMRRTT
jgi:hypothetical protein